MTRQFGVVHGLAERRDCGWTTQSYKNAQALAVRHAKAHGHEVQGEVGYAYTYTGDPKPKAAEKGEPHA